MVFKTIGDKSTPIIFFIFGNEKYQIREPEGFARMLETIIETDRLPKLRILS